MILLESKNITGEVKDARERKVIVEVKKRERRSVSIETVGRGRSVPMSSSSHPHSFKSAVYSSVVPAFQIW